MNGTLDNSGASKKLIVADGNVAVGNGGLIDLDDSFILNFLLTTRGAFGLLEALGANTLLSNCTISGTATKETWAYFSTPLATGVCNVSDVTFDYMTRYSSTYVGGIVLIGWNKSVSGLCVLGNITITNTSNAVAGYDIYLGYGALEAGTGTITANATGATAGCMYTYYAIIAGGTWNLTCASGSAIYPHYSSFIGGTFNLTTSGTAIGITFYIGSCADGIIINQTHTAANFAMVVVGSIVRNTTMAISTTTYGVRFDYCYLDSGTAITVTGGNQPAFYLRMGTVIDGTILTVKNNTSIGVGFSEGYTLLLSGKIDIQSSCSGIGIAYATSNTPINYQEITHTGTFQIINDTSGTKLTEANYQTIEPFLFVSSTANKYFTIYFPMYPSNQSDFTTTGTVSFYTTAGATVMTGASTLLTPTVKPFQVTTWGTFTVTKAGAGVPTYEYQVSADGGNTWGALVAIASGGVIGAVPNNDGLDAIRFKVTLPALTTTLQSIVITNNVYTDINGGMTYILNNSDMEYV